MECKVEANKEKCACTYDTCERQGICCDCLKNHLSSESLPACMKNLDWLRVVG